jgi:hypothetical protein
VEYPLLEEKLVGGAPAPNDNPLDEELLEVGIVIHADIAIAPRLHSVIAAIRANRLMQPIIVPRGSFANRAQPAGGRTPTYANSAGTWPELGQPARAMLASTAQGSHEWGRFRI